MQLGTRLRKLREEKRLSQKEVAEQLNVSTATYNNWESDLAEPKTSMLLKLAELFEADVTDLLPSNAKVQIIHNNNDRAIGGFVEIHTENAVLRDKLIQQLESQLQDKERIIQDKERVIQMQNELIARLQEETRKKDK